jgi:hypothetical protein
MPASDANLIALPEKGAITRSADTVFSHQMPGTSSEAFLKSAIEMNVTGEVNGSLKVQVTVKNTAAGHHYPTDSPLRHLILVVDARQANGEELNLLNGPRVPDWGGIIQFNGNSDTARYYGGKPGTAYAKILEEVWTLTSPSGAYWNPTRVVSDNRLSAYGSDVSLYEFELPVEGNFAVDVSLIYRRAFIALMDQKGWKVPDVVLAQSHLEFAK